MAIGSLALLGVTLLSVTLMGVTPLWAEETLRGVPEVIDGDTIELQGRRLRLQGIDAPELGQLCWLGSGLYDCGMVARTALLDLSAGAQVVCRPLGPGSKNIPLAHCAADGYDLSEGMTYTGWALADPAQTSTYGRQEAGARDAVRGLWRGRFVAPWDWRGGARLPEESQGG
jgi:endonuclease YncB( thermonuclease family)